MPYKLVETDKGYFVENTETGERKNKDAMPEKRAKSYMRALYTAEAGITKKEHDGIMVALMLPAAIAGQVALPEGSVGEGGVVLPPEELHVTLCYFGDKGIESLTPEQLIPGLTLFALHCPKITGKLNGYGRFLDTHLNGLQCVYLNFDSVTLTKARHELYEMLEAVLPAPEHGFTPHVTLAYLPEDDPMPEGLPEQSLEVAFDRITLAYGYERYEFYLSGEAMARHMNPAPMAEYTEKEGALESEMLFSTQEGKTWANTEKHMKGQHDQAEHSEGKKNFKKNQIGEGPSDKKKNVLGDPSAKPSSQGENSPTQETPAGSSATNASGAARADGKIEKKTNPKAREADSRNYRPEKRPRGGQRTPQGRSREARIGATNKENGFMKNQVIQKVLEFLTPLFSSGKTETAGAEGFFTLKQKDGSYRWVGFSSNPYRDRDRQYVSLKALENDVARADQDGQYGPLLWWHTGAKLGDTDFNAMAGKILIESGTFINPEIGAAISKEADTLQLSLGMLHPLNQPDQAGVYHFIRRYERSLLPLGRAANPLTAFLVKEKPLMKTLTVEKEAQLRSLLGNDVADIVLKQASAIEKSADELGLTFKQDEAMEDEEEEEGEEEETMKMADLSPETFASLIAGAVTKGLEPVVTTLKELKTAQTEKEKQAPQTDTLKTQLAEQAQAITALQTQLAAATKEFQAKAKEIEGDLPPAIAALMKMTPTTTPSNVVSKESAEGPAPDPLDQFFQFASPYAAAKQ